MSNNHLVPQVYLKNFSNQNQIYVFDKKIKNYFRGMPNIKNVACEKNFYDKKLESYFGDKIEPDFDKFAKYLFENNTLPTKESDEFIYFIRFLNLQQQRVKSKREIINNTTKKL